MSKCDSTLPPSHARFQDKAAESLSQLQNLLEDGKEKALRMPSPYGGRLNNIETFLLAVGAINIFLKFCMQIRSYQCHKCLSHSYNHNSTSGPLGPRRIVN